MRNRTFTVTTAMQGALPRSKRLKAALGGSVMTGGTGGSGSVVGSGGDGHSHANKSLLDSLLGDDEGYLYILAKQGESDDSVAAKVLAGGADEWAGHLFDDWMDQPVRTVDGVRFASVTVDKVVFTNGASLEVDGDVLKFSSGIWSMGEVAAYGKGGSSGSGGGGGNYPLLTYWDDYTDDMADSYALGAGLGVYLKGLSHSHGNKSVLDGITSAKVAAWDAAANGIGKYLLTSWNDYSADKAGSYAISAGLGYNIYDNTKWFYTVNLNDSALDFHGFSGDTEMVGGGSLGISDPDNCAPLLAFFDDDYSYTLGGICVSVRPYASSTPYGAIMYLFMGEASSQTSGIAINDSGDLLIHAQGDRGYGTYFESMGGDFTYTLNMPDGSIGTVSRIVFANGASLEVDGDVLKFSSGIYSLGEVAAYGKGGSSGSGGGGGNYPLLTSWDDYTDDMADSYALGAGLGVYLKGLSHSHGNKSVLDGITSAKVAAWDAAASGSGSDGISGYLLTAWADHSSAIADTYALSARLGWDLNSRAISLEKVTHSHSNKSVLEGITAAKVAAWDAAASGSGGGSGSGGNASQAEKLANARKLWGNSFDGSADINGLLDASTNGIKTNKITFTNGASIEADGDVLKFSTGIWSMGEVAAYGKGTSGGSSGGSGGTVSGYAKRLEFVYDNDDPTTVRLKITGYDATETGVKIYLMRNLKRKLCFRYDPTSLSRTNYHTTSGWRHPLNGVRHSYSNQSMTTEWNVTAETWEMSAATIFDQFKGKGLRMNHQRLDFDHRIKGFGFALYKDGVRISNICRVDVTVSVTDNAGSVKAYPAL